MSAPLYQMTGELTEVHSLVLSGEISAEDVTDTLEALEGEFNQKAISVGHFILNLTPTIEALDLEIKRLQARKKAIQNKQESVKDYLRRNMQAAEISKIECDLFSILCKKPRQIVHVDDESALPDEMVKVKTTITPDKVAIGKALKEGMDVPGAHLEYSQAPIEIK